MEMRWYAPVSDGRFSDIVYDLRSAGASCAGEHPAQCSFRGVSFTLVHDVEGGIRAYVTNPGALGYAGAWSLIDSFLPRAGERTGLDVPQSIQQLGQDAWQRGSQAAEEAWQKYGPPSPTEIGRRLGEAGRDIAKNLPIPRIDLDKPARRVEYGLKSFAVILGVAIVGAVTISALVRR
jgi:hypothetical protein